MTDALPRDPLLCRCGKPKRAEQFQCADCLYREELSEPERSIDDPPARDYPQAFGEGGSD